MLEYLNHTIILLPTKVYPILAILFSPILFLAFLTIHFWLVQFFDFGPDKLMDITVVLELLYGLCFVVNETKRKDFDWLLSQYTCEENDFWVSNFVQVYSEETWQIH